MTVATQLMPSSTEQALFKKKHPAVSVIIPVYQEEENIVSCVEDVLQSLDAATYDFEIVVVDDGSKDLTPQLLSQIQARHPLRVRVVHHVNNRGNGAALRTGIRVARGEIVVTMDADGQHNGKEIYNLLVHMPPYDLVIGSRQKHYIGSWYRNYANAIYNSLATWLTGTRVEDLTSGFRAMRRDVVWHYLHLFPAKFSSPTTTTMAFLKAGYNVKFVPVEVKQRASGRSKINILRDGGQFLIIILRMITLYDPLKVFLPTAWILLIGGLIATVLGIIAAQRLVVPGSAVVLFISAVQVLLLGLIAGQVSTISIPYYGDETVVIEDITSPEDERKTS